MPTSESLRMLFFFTCSGDPRDLHSFPTRRSSDLEERLGAHEQNPVGHRRDHRAAGDRKSTRLNSSHVETSYAVFCLKKKNVPAVQHLSEAIADREPVEAGRRPDRPRRQLATPAAA